MVESIDWKPALSLGELIYKWVKEDKLNSKDFELLLQHFGREKLKNLYLEEKGKEKKNDSISW